MSRLPSIGGLSANQSGWGFFLCVEKSLRTGRGGEYLAVVLQDATGQIAGRIFDNVERLRDEFDESEFVKVQGRVQLFNGRLQFVIEQIRRVMTGPASQDRREGFDENVLLPAAPRPLDEMWADLERLVAGINDGHLRVLAETIIRRHDARLRVWPAARTVHHAYRGGLLEHILKMAEAGRALALLYGADADLVTVGTLLHDIGKLQELEYSTTVTYSRDGNLVGHVALGVLMVDDACRAIAGFPDDRRTAVMHLIVSHHGAREHGAPLEPMTIEAIILAAVDSLDATINQVERAIRDDDGSSEFTPYHPRLGRSFWKGLAG